MDSIKIMEETSSNPMSCAHRNMKQMRSPFAVSFILGERKSNSPTQKGWVGLRQTSSLRANKPKPKMTHPSVKKQGSWANTGGMWVIKNEIGRLAHDWWQCVYTDTKWSREWRIHLKRKMENENLVFLEYYLLFFTQYQSQYQFNVIVLTVSSLKTGTMS